ncbi:PP2C family protein-serine/threonine phosphatase [Streptomyces sp. ISL-86]|uniref:PP2C family protein-serine/threonine phosphatase n=1 Tax=Streptomyces sp. ISL-86 TaxID=2819187 RepID=UPI001BEB92B1|nr:PP2C family protein-serine/threonine phosphatase [Streptomyces sp. ISL-86]MBT2457437.1 serine/threonine-protein phosphatase [Streptomyces sp. ISL-86]
MDDRLPHPRLRRYPEPRMAMLSVPFALIAIVTVVDVLAPPDVHLGPFLVAAPAVTASFAGPRMTGFVGAVAVLAQSMVAVARTTLTDLNHTFQIIALVLISAFVTFFAHLREVREEQLTQLRSVAEAAQQVVLRPLRDRMGPLRVASVYLAAEAEAQIGGDLYAAARTAHSTRLIIGDVRGKGLEAVGEAAIVLGAFRASAHQEADLPGLVSYLEAAVTADPDGSGDDPAPPGEGFTTAAVLDIRDQEMTLQLISCGHPPPLLLRGGRVIPLEVDNPAPPLGLTQFVDTGFAPQYFGFETGDIVLLYTDGVVEARDASGAFYPLPDRVADWPGDGPEALLRHLCADLLSHSPGGRLGDDAAMVAIERVGGQS